MDLPLLPTLNASLNGLAGVFLLCGFAMIKRGRERAHARCMKAAFLSSVAFLACYLYYHFTNELLVRYAGPAWGKTPYLVLLLTHTVLAAAVPFLAVRTLWLALKDRREDHRRWARKTLPLWLYVSATGVLIYLVLYVFTDSGALALGGAGTEG
ncbi:MAG: DUF420 domain-containing protein [Planctomycetes bacterium]|nr:DUF420 domain-containing protein [Planctomycetota bacterium]MBL7009330.1 DUF420 domain-containing protein [Planctomycetota bacterium]